MTHPTPEELARYALEGRTHARVEAHVEECGSCRVDVAHFLDAGDLIHAAVRSPSPPGPCLDEGTIAALADETLEPTMRGGIAAHLAGCARCRGMFADAYAALRDPAIAREIAALRNENLTPRRLRYAIPAAVAALLAFLLLPLAIDDSTAPTHRAPATTGGAAPVSVGPEGPSSRPSALRWRSIPEADRYRVTLYADDGTVLFETTAADTVAAIPDTIPLQSGETYYWTVSGRTGYDRWRSSRPVEFTLTPPLP